MPMTPMAPKAVLPPVAAFRLLADLNEFLAHPLEERQTALVDYLEAVEEREAALEQIETAVEASKVDRAAAAAVKREADESARVIVADAEVKATEVIGAATEQAESVNETTRENVAQATADSKTSGARLKKREDAVQDREEACEVREANAFKEREDAVLLREQDVAEGEKGLKRLTAQATAVKNTYEKLMADINALQRRAPK